MNLGERNSVGALQLSGSLDIDRAASLKESILACLVHPDVNLDLAMVESIDTAALQVLLAAQKNAALLGKRCHMTVSPAVGELAAALGFSLDKSGSN